LTLLLLRHMNLPGWLVEVIKITMPCRSVFLV